MSPATQTALNSRVGLTGFEFDPEYNSNWYVSRSAKGGAASESVQVIVKGLPPVTESPAAGTMNLTSARAKRTDAQ